jgi:hypothetical protein
VFYGALRLFSSAAWPSARSRTAEAISPQFLLIQNRRMPDDVRQHIKAQFRFDDESRGAMKYKNPFMTCPV